MPSVQIQKVRTKLQRLLGLEVRQWRMDTIAKLRERLEAGQAEGVPLVPEQLIREDRER